MCIRDRASAEICTVWMTFRVSQVAWPETFKLCYDGISVWICPPKLSDLTYGGWLKSIDHVHNKVVSKEINMIKWRGWMASAEVCTLWMIFIVSQVAWSETFKLCNDGISVWICPPKLSDLKLWRMAKIHSCWTDQHHLPKYWIQHSIIAFQVSLWVPIVQVLYMEWDPIVTGTLTQWHTHNHTPDHVHNKVVSKQINVIKW